MARRITDSKGRLCTYIIFPNDTAYREVLIGYAKKNGYDIRFIRIGYKGERVVLVPASQEIHDTIFRADDREQKVRTADKDRLTSMEEAMEKAGDSSCEMLETAVGYRSESHKYDAAREIILEHIKKHHPDRYDQFVLQFDDYSRSKAAEKLGIAKSTAYKLGKALTKELEDILYSLEYLNVKEYRRK